MSWPGLVGRSSVSSFRRETRNWSADSGLPDLSGLLERSGFRRIPDAVRLTPCGLSVKRLQVDPESVIEGDTYDCRSFATSQLGAPEPCCVVREKVQARNKGLRYSSGETEMGNATGSGD